ncbi:MAG: exported protein of unknown function [Microvirga sp.]|nr:exported protein of unknown function [Microvirga sp.]
MSKKRIALPAVCVLALLWLGYARTVTVDVIGTQKTDTVLPSHVTYAVLPTTEVEKDRTFPDYAKLVANQLEHRGYRQTDAKVAKLGVYLAYSISERSTSPSTSTALQGAGSPSGMASGGGSSGYGYGTMASSPPDERASRYTTQVVVVVLDLPNSRDTGSLVELWRGEAVAAGNSNDLPGMAPVLVEAAFRHFGETTANKVQHAFGDDEMKKLREAR